MIKRKNLTSGTEYSNSMGDKAFVGSRIEGTQRVTTIVMEVPYEDAITGEIFMVKDTRKVSVPVNSLPADYAVAQEKANSYQAQELPDSTARAAMAAGAIEWTIEDINPA